MLLVTADEWGRRNPDATLTEQADGWWVQLPPAADEPVIPADVNRPLDGQGRRVRATTADIFAQLAAATRTANADEQARVVRDVCRHHVVPELDLNGLPTHHTSHPDGVVRAARLPVADVIATAAGIDALTRCFTALPNNPPPKFAFTATLAWAQRIGLSEERAATWQAGPDTRPRSDLRLLLSQTMGETLRAFGVTVGVGWEAHHTPAPVMYAPNLFGQATAGIVLRMGSAAGPSRPAVRCAECGTVVPGARIRSDTTTVYCDSPDCRRAKERDRKRRQREAKAGAR